MSIIKKFSPDREKKKTRSTTSRETKMHAWFTEITKEDLSSVINGKSDKTY